jgi:preprotein translocase subunit SecA
VFKWLGGDSNEKELKHLQPTVDSINELEPEFKKLSDDGLRAKTDEFKERIAKGESLDKLLPEAYAAVREAARRTIGQRHFDVQLMGGIVLHQGKIAEMKTGEGKTLVATLPLYLNSLTGKGAHLVTVNDYLARRDPYWMGPVYNALGVSVASIYPMQSPDERAPTRLYDPEHDSGESRWPHFRSTSRAEAYQADITYGASSEFGFDYLRDNMVSDLSRYVQRPLNYAIVDEVDYLLIDEARTPLIISAPDVEAGKKYQIFARLVPALKKEIDYTVDEKTRAVSLTDNGMTSMERMLRREGLLQSPNLYDPANADLHRYLRNALSAKEVYKRDHQYVVKDGQVVIVDDFTGRLMYGRRYSDGLHQAIEAKERVKVQQESRTYATITIQNYFRMYEKLAGMTGTALTEAEEFHKIYKLDVVVIPTHRDMVRQDLPDFIYKTEEAKFKAVVEEITRLHKEGRPVLIGTVSIENSEYLSDLLKKRGIPHHVLNAKEHTREGEIVAQAGQPGAVTVATNMAGRGVDIILGGTPPDYMPEESLAGYIREKEKEFIDKAEPYLEEEGYAERKEEHQENLKRHGEEIRQSAERIRLIYLTELTEENQSQKTEEIQQLEEKIRQALKDYRDEYLSWEKEVEEKLKQKIIELEKAGQTTILEKIKEILGFKSKEPKLSQNIEEIIQEHKQFKDWRREHQKVLDMGGLNIIGTERHEARRIDNQLRGRAGRQGDPGTSRFYTSVEDDIVRRFGGDRLKTVMGWAGMDEDTPIENKWINKAIEQAQVKVEGYHFDIRKHLVDYDDVVNKHRELIYEERKKILSGADLKSNILSMVKDELESLVETHTVGYDDGWDMEGLVGELAAFFPLPPNLNAETLAKMGAQEIKGQLIEQAETLYEAKEKEVGADNMRILERLLMLRIIDSLWVEHLTAMEHMRQGIGLHAVAQRDPLVAYKREGHNMFQNLMAAIQHDMAHTIYRAQISRKGETPQKQAAPTQTPMAAAAQAQTGGEARKKLKVKGKKVGRNDPCPCGSGKKYKHCCGR